MKIYLLLLALLLCNVSFAQLRTQAANKGGLSSLGSSSINQGTEEAAAETSPLTLDIESGSVFGGNSGEPEVENDLEDEGLIEEEVVKLPEEETPIVGGWEPVDVTQAENNPDFSTVYDYSVDYVLEQAYQATLLTGNYNTKKIMNAYKQEANGINYKIDCEVYNEEGTPVKVSVLAWYQKETNSREMKNFTYSYKYTDEDNSQSDVTVGWDKETAKYTVDIVPDYATYPDKQPENYELDLTGYLAMGGYNPVPVDEIYKDKDLENYVKYGAQEVVKYGKEKGYLNQAYTYNVKQVQSIYGQWNEDRSDKWYRCEIEYDDGYGGSAVASYEVHFQAAAEKPEIPTIGFKRIQNS